MIERHEELVEIVRDWCKNHRLETPDNADALEIGVLIKNDPKFRKTLWEFGHSRVVEILEEELHIYETILGMLVGERTKDAGKKSRIVSVRIITEPLRSIYSDIKNRPNIKDEILVEIDMHRKELERLQAKRRTSRKGLLQVLAPWVKELSRSAINEGEQINILVELFERLGYQNKGGKASKETIYNDVRAMRYDILYPPPVK